MIHSSAVTHIRMIPLWRTATLSCLIALSALACAGAQTKADDEQEETWVPEKTQQAAAELEGQQQMMMDELNMTPAERAAARHENATRPVEREKNAPREK